MNPTYWWTELRPAACATSNGGDFFKLLVTPHLDARSDANTAAIGATLDAPNPGLVSLGDDTDYDGTGELTLTGAFYGVP